jgi:hypothetical protein
MVGIPHMYIYVHTPSLIDILDLSGNACLVKCKTSFQAFKCLFFRLKDSEGVGKMSMVGYECGDSADQCFVYFFNFAVIFSSNALLFRSVQRPNLQTFKEPRSRFRQAVN